jgi:programmed cell death 6-interacting protein
MVSQEAADQDRLAQKLIESNAAFIQARKGDTSTKEREKALQSLENAYFKYKEIISNLEAGRKFYNDLAKIMSKFRDECRTFVYQRRADATQMEAYVTHVGPSRSITNPSSIVS